MNSSVSAHNLKYHNMSANRSIPHPQAHPELSIEWRHVRSLNQRDLLRGYACNRHRTADRFVKKSLKKEIPLREAELTVAAAVLRQTDISPTAAVCEPFTMVKVQSFPRNSNWIPAHNSPSFFLCCSMACCRWVLEIT